MSDEIDNMELGPEPEGAGRQGSRMAGADKARKAEGPGVIAAAVKDVQRLREIVAVLTRHGFSQIIRSAGLDKILGQRLTTPVDAEPVDPSDRRGMARRLRNVLEDLGTTFIKLGQILSTRRDLLPQVYIQEFTRLQDSVPAMPFEEVRTQVEEGLGAPLEELYASFEVEPLATASIAQVHEAVTREGRRVVVKVQRTGIAEQIRSDLDILHFLSRILKATIEEMDVYNVQEIVNEFERAIKQEIDFLNEARNVERVQANHADDDNVVIPDILRELSSQTILTMEFLDGKKLRDIEPDSPEAQALTEVLLEAAFNQIFDHGVFHGDPHPGNILVLGPATVGFIDFGLTGTLSRAQQDDLIALLITIITGDTDGIARTILRMGHPQGRVNLGAFRREIAEKRDRYLSGNLEQIDVGAFTADLMEAALRYKIKLNSEYAVLVKATVAVDGMLRTLTPTMDLAATAGPFAKRLIADRYSSKRILAEVFSGAMSLSGFLRDVPAQLDQVLMDIESGTVSVNVEHPGLDELGPALASLGTRIFLGFACCGLLIGGSVMIAQLDYRPFDIPILLFVGLLFLISAGWVAFWAIGLPLLNNRVKRVKIGPLIRLMRKRK
jgi:ubiquinone biosynthesis protein